jgi:tyrosine-protein phosphatase SIW14
MRIPMRYRYLSVFLLPIAVHPAWASDATVRGIPNFHQVNDHVYRGGQPSDEAWAGLAQLGVKTVIDLRLEDEHPTKLEAQAVQAAGMRYINIPMHGVVAPSDEQVASLLALLDSDSPVFIHCKRGADRTGAVIACYRMAHDRWDNQRALKEAKSYGMSWLQFGIKNYVMNFQTPAVRVATAPELQPAAGH